MKLFTQGSLILAGILLSAGVSLAQTQTNTFNFAPPNCADAGTCGVAGGTNRLIESVGTEFFFQEQVAIQENGTEKLLNHMIIRSKPDGSNGSTFVQETFTPGGAIQGATNTTSTNQLTFKQTLKAAGDGAGVPSVDVLVRMDNMNLINRTNEAGLVGTEINISQKIVDAAQGLVKNELTLTPNTATPAAGDFITKIDQQLKDSDPTNTTFFSNIIFNTGSAAVITQGF